MEFSIGQQVKGDLIDAKVQVIIVKLARWQREAVSGALRNNWGKNDKKVNNLIENGQLQNQFAYLGKLSEE